MLSRTTKFAAAASLAGVLCLGATTGAFAAPAAGPHLTPANTAITGKLKTGTDLTATGTIDGVSISVTCTKITLAGKTPANGVTITASKTPTFSGCSDSLGGTDTVKTNSTNGKWKVSWSSATVAALVIPKAGVTFSSSVLSSCVVTLAPAGAANVTGKWSNSTSALTETNSKVPTKGTGCSTSADATISATAVTTPKIKYVA